MDLQEKQPRKSEIEPPKLGVYVHVPFCASSCDFCAFYQEKPRRADLDLYLDTMDREFALLPQDREVETIFWGGGTPGLLPAKDLERLGRSLTDRLIQPAKEWTVEMAPSTVKADKLAALRAMGVTRISMGVQSFNEELLESLGRLHRPNQIYQAWALIEEAGFPQTNLDLMFALPNQTLADWEADIREAAQLGPNHLSTYCLTFEEDTALYVKLSEGKVKIDEDKELRFYEHGWDLLAELGYAQYEISNFSKPGGECIHNMNTWRMQEWIGCGPSAASQFAGERYQRPSNLQEWASAFTDDPSGPKSDLLPVDADVLLADSLIFGLRTNAGVNLDELAQRFPGYQRSGSVDALFSRFEDEGYLRRKGAQLTLTRSGQLVVDGIGSELLSI